MLATRPPHHRRPLGQPVLDDWSRLAARHCDLGPALVAAGYTHLGEPRAAPDATPRTGADLALARLVRAAARDPMAARVVLQRILPGLLSIARRRSRGHLAVTYEVLDELLAVGWLVISAHPVDRRRGFVAGNLLRDIEYQAFTAPQRRAARWREVLVEDHEPAVEGGPPSTFDQVIEVLGDGRAAGMDPSDLRFAANLANGSTIAELAATRRVSQRATRYRRTRVAAQLRTATLGWADGDRS